MEKPAGDAVRDERQIELYLIAFGCFLHGRDIDVEGNKEILIRLKLCVR